MAYKYLLPNRLTVEKLLVIGATGLLGNRLMELAKGRYEVYGTRNSSSNNAANIHKLDVCDRKSTFSLMERIKPDFVIDTHSLTNLDYCETHPEETWKVIVEGSKNAAEASKKFGARYVFLSTDYVFDGKKPSYTERDTPNPINCYARTKLAAERALSELDIDHIIARTTVLYGVGGIGKASFAVWLINRLRANERVNIVTDQRNCPTFTDNLSEFLFRLYEKDAAGVFHVTGKECISRYDFAVRIAAKFGLERNLITPVTTAELNQVAPRPLSINMITEKAEKATGLRALDVDGGLSLFRKQLG